MPFNVGPVELIIVLVIALLVIGPRRLPEMGNAVGKTIREFRKASTEISEATSLEQESKPSADAAAAPPAAAPSQEATAPAATLEAAPAESTPTEPAPAQPAEPARAQPAETKSDDD